MADSREPPPLFNDDDDSRKDDDNDDLFTSAVQSPVSEVRTPSPPEDDQEQPLASAAGHADPLTSSPSTSPTPPVVDTQATSPILADVPAQLDMFESCREEPPVDAFASVSLNQESAENGLAELPHEQEVSLDDDPDDAGLFQAVNTPKLQLNQEASEVNPATVLPTVGAPLTSPVLPPLGNTTPTLSPGAPVPISPVSAVNRSSAEQMERDGGDEFIEIQVSDPQKIGDGMSSYMAYKITTKTNISYFKKSHWGVTRRFSDFLGLHSKLVAKHLHSGRIIPPAPSKDAIGSSKLKFGAKETQDTGGNEFIERRRASLERYMNRTAEHPTLRADPDFREFVELDAELPKATQTSALSSAGVLRLFNRVGETVNKMTFKMDESDQWFEDKTQSMESLEVQLRKLHAAMEALVGHRRELAGSTQSFSKSCAVLSSVEEHSALSRALHQLAESTERTHTIHHAQGDADFFLLSETTKDYISLLGAVKEVFHERIKTFQTWQHGQQVLAKKREGKAKAEMAGRMDKVQLAQEEVLEWEGKVERSQEEFERVSRAIKKEMEQFDIIRVKDFKDMLVKYLEALMTSQQQIIKVWETFLPEAKSITT